MIRLRSISIPAVVSFIILMAVSPVSAADFVYQGDFGLELAVGDVVAYEDYEYFQMKNLFENIEENSTTYVKVNVTGISNITDGYNITTKSWYANSSLDPEKDEGWVNETDSSYVFNRSASTWQHNIPSELTCNDLNETIVEAMLFDYVDVNNVPENTSDTTYYIHEHTTSSKVTFKNETELHYEYNEYINYTESSTAGSSEAQPLQTSSYQTELIYTVKLLLRINGTSKLITYHQVEMNSTYKQATYYDTYYHLRRRTSYYQRITVTPGDKPSEWELYSYASVPGYMWELVLGTIVVTAVLAPIFIKKFKVNYRY